jgi:hypothetical protein
MACETCTKPVDGKTGIKVSTGWENEAERLDYEFCGPDCLRGYLDTNWRT